MVKSTGINWYVSILQKKNPKKENKNAQPVATADRSPLGCSG
jgi:hypothetical protein